MDCLPDFRSALSSLFESSSPSRISNPGSSASTGPVDLLLLGSGWTGTFLLPLSGEAGLRTAWTTRNGGGGSIPFEFDPNSHQDGGDDDEDDGQLDKFRILPDAKTIVVIFPIYVKGGVVRLLRGYEKSRGAGVEGGKGEGKGLDVEGTRWILLGSTGIWDHGPTFSPLTSTTAPPPYYLSPPIESEKKKPSPSPPSPWVDRHSPYDKTIPRAAAEDEFLSLSQPNNPLGSSPRNVSVLNLSGLWGHGRSPRRFIARGAPSKDVLGSLASVHLVHGRDVARSIIAMHNQFVKAQGQRWILTNQRVYDWWDLASRWGNAGEDGRDHPPVGPQVGWVQELIRESGGKVKALPRSVEQMGRGLDGTDFWNTFEITPQVPWVD